MSLIHCSSYDSYVMDTVLVADTGVVHCIAVHTVLIRKLQAQLVLLICGTVYDSCVLDTVYIVSCMLVADTGVAQRHQIFVLVHASKYTKCMQCVSENYNLPTSVILINRSYCATNRKGSWKSFDYKLSPRQLCDREKTSVCTDLIGKTSAD